MITEEKKMKIFSGNKFVGVGTIVLSYVLVTLAVFIIEDGFKGTLLIVRRLAEEIFSPAVWSQSGWVSDAMYAGGATAWLFLSSTSILALVAGAAAMILGPIYEFVGVKYREEGWDDWLFSKNKQPLLCSLLLGVYSLAAGHVSSLVGPSSWPFASVLNFWFYWPVVGIIYGVAVAVSLLLCFYEMIPAFRLRR